jgi:hypothetical protein
MIASDHFFRNLSAFSQSRFSIRAKVFRRSSIPTRRAYPTPRTCLDATARRTEDMQQRYQNNCGY